MRKLISVVVLAVVLTTNSVVFAHSGGTDSNGCHTNHKTGDYHCHKPK